MKQETLKLKKSAMQFIEENCFAVTNNSDEGKPSLEMIAYSGKTIKGHWYWGDVAFDVSGFSFAKKIPILEDHYTSKKIGFATKINKDNNQLTIGEGFVFIDTPESLAFRQNSLAGFPYQASIYGIPTVIEQLSEGETAEVNGYTFKGPGTIWRKTILKEASICTFGYDPNTKSVVMSEEDEEVMVEYLTEKDSTEENKFSEKEETNMKVTVDQFKTESPEEYDAVVKEIEAKFSGKLASLEAELKTAKEANGTLADTNNKLSEEIKGAEVRLLALEKTEILRHEKDLTNSANEIFNVKFVEAEIPERLHDKVRRLITHEAFIKEGELDVEAFTAAVVTELKDWTSEEDSTVHGFSVHSKNFDGGSSAKEMESDAIVNRMLNHCGQTPAEKK